MKEKRKSLGKGLDTIISSVPTTTLPKVSQHPTAPQPTTQITTQESLSPTVKENVVLLPVSALKPSKYQVRETISESALEELANSISSKGILVPILVRKIDDANYEIIAGERRYRAAKKLNLEKIPAIVRETSSAEALEIALIENLQREDLNPIETAKAYQQLIDNLGLSHEEVAHRVGKDRATVTNTLRLLSLPESVQEYVADGRISAGHARALLSLKNEELCKNVANLIISKGLSVRQTEQLVKKLTSAPIRKKEAITVQLPDIISLENQLQRKLGTKVKLISSDARKGRIVIYFYSPEDLERILNLLNG